MTNIDLQKSCWTVTQKPNSKGYVQVRVKNKLILLHRLTYETFINAIDKGLVIDHLCKEPACCNPAHLEAVTQAENIKRGKTGIHLKNKTHCIRGHEYNEENTYHHKNKRYCRKCNQISYRKYRHKKRIIKIWQA